MPKQTPTKLAGALGEAALARLRAICSALPDSRETLTWGSPHFRIDDKIFCGIGDEKGRLTIGFKLEMDHAHALVQDERFWPSPYVGRHGWVTTEVTPKTNWRQIKAFVEESYGLIAPKPKGLRPPKTSAKRKR